MIIIDAMVNPDYSLRTLSFNVFFWFLIDITWKYLQIRKLNLVPDDSDSCFNREGKPYGCWFSTNHVTSSHCCMLKNSYVSLKLWLSQLWFASWYLEWNMSKHPRHALIGLEQCTRTSMQRAIMFHGAIAVLHCPDSKHFVRKREVC